MIQESLGEMARLHAKALSGAKWEIIIGTALLLLATYCIKAGKIWIPRTFNFADKASDPWHFWLGEISLIGISAWLIGEGLIQLHHLGVF